MPIRDRGNNFFVDFEDNGFGGSAMEQNEALANIINPPIAAPIPAPVEKPAETPAPKTNNATIEALIKQIQARSDTSRWTGGYGADQATKDMARILAETGITDISQFGPITREVQKVVGYEDWGDPIYQTVTEQTFGNKETGQAVPNTYTERQTGNFFGGTYEGKGNTGYGVQFDDQGLPVFYTQGASSSDMGSIAPFLTLASFVPGLAPFAMAANAAIAAKQDNPLGVITNLAGMGNLAGVSGMADVANAARFAGAVKSGDPLAIAFSGANLAGVSDVGGVNLKDVSKAIGAVKAIESGDPLAIMLYGMDAMSGSGGSSPTKSSADLQAEDPLSPEEQEQLIENRLNTAISRSQISPEEEDANTQRLIEELERTYGPESTTTLPSLPTRSLGGPQVEEADDFLKSIGINTIDKPSDSGLSNQDILNLINADNEVLVTSNRDTVGKGVSEDIFRNLEDAGEPPSLTPAEKLSELVIKGDRPKEETTVQQEPANIEEFIKSLEPYVAPAPTPEPEPVALPSPDEDFMPTYPEENIPELVITGERPTEEMTVQQEPANLEEFLKSLEPYIAPAEKLEELVIKSERPMPSPDEDFMPTPIANEEKLPELVMTSNRDKTQEHVFDPTFGGTLPLPEVPVTPIPPVATPKVPTPPKASTPAKTTPAASAPSSPFIYQEPVNQNIIPELAKVFYFGKNFGGQQQQLSPEGELLTTPYNQLSVTQAGAEPMPQPIPVAQDAKGGENDISALLQQIMSSGDPNMTQEELMQLIQSRG
jgi:hypothetical protein